MIIEVIKGQELTEEHLKIWRDIQDKNSKLQSPYFSPEFICILAEIRKDIYISLIIQDEKIRGFFPFQKRGRRAFPAGGKLSDIHGVIAYNDVRIKPIELIKKSRISSYEFYNIPLWQKSFLPYINERKTFYYIDISKGFEDYRQHQLEKKSKTIKDSEYKLRKISRDYSNIKFHHFIENKEVLDQLLDWKSQQYKRSNLLDVFSFSWSLNLIYRIFNCRTDKFSGMLSSLDTGGKPIAIHFGMITDKVWNWWFPRHNNTYNKYSPGILLRLDAIKYAAKHGIHRIELGCGDEKSYKPHISTDSYELGSGIIETSKLHLFLSTNIERFFTFLRNCKLYSLMKKPLRFLNKKRIHNKYK